MKQITIYTCPPNFIIHADQTNQPSGKWQHATHILLSPVSQAAAAASVSEQLPPLIVITQSHLLSQSVSYSLYPLASYNEQFIAKSTTLIASTSAAAADHPSNSQFRYTTPHAKRRELSLSFNPRAACLQPDVPRRKCDRDRFIK